MKRGPKGLSVGTFGFLVVAYLEDPPSGMSLDELYSKLEKDFSGDPDLYPSTRRRMERILWDQKLFGYVERVSGKWRHWRVTKAGRQAVQAANDRFENGG